MKSSSMESRLHALTDNAEKGSTYHDQQKVGMMKKKKCKLLLAQKKKKNHPRTGSHETGLYFS